MKLMRSLRWFLLFIGIGFTTLGVRAEVVEGRDYTVLQRPQPTQSDNNIEVIEFF